MRAGRSCHLRPTSPTAIGIGGRLRTGAGRAAFPRRTCGHRPRTSLLTAACGLLLALAWCAPAGAATAATPSALAAPAGQAAALSGLAAKAWLIADAGTGAILAASGLHNRDLPASTMKILTALTIMPGLQPDQQITMSDSASRVDGTRVGLVPGVGYSVRDLATAMLISSGNDATMALVEASGGTAAVLQRMNALTVTLGAHDTVAGDPTGLDSPGQVTSVYDLAVFGRAALDEPSVRQYLTIPRASLPGRDNQRFEIQNHNLLLGRYDGTVGVKNGYTVAAGATYVGAATRGGRTLIVSLLRTAPAFDKDARALLDWGFAHDGQVTPVGYLPSAGQQPAADTAPRATAVAGVAASPAAPATQSARAAGGRDGLLGGIGPATWIAATLTAAAALVTVLMGGATRRRRRRLVVSSRLAATSAGPPTVPVSRSAGQFDRLPADAPRRAPARSLAERELRGPRLVPPSERPTGPVRRRPPDGGGRRVTSRPGSTEYGFGEPGAETDEHGHQSGGYRDHDADLADPGRVGHLRFSDGRPTENGVRPGHPVGEPGGLFAEDWLAEDWLDEEEEQHAHGGSRVTRFGRSARFGDASGR
ncbi:serine hydrolase [Frankia sp. AgB32]|uniref:serine hydrolase n=1 Tax=Frankia sp. AgB32 TaxID=631119 RepID=UPI00200F05DC|nr:serine hydrolase [Frankia sp. AgB32]MCK9896893.1 serine hydrolase [Frankia sp. AgB32]